ncbi:MAG: rod shape-determining protein MreC [Candidatus Omnitrophica bacterium]|nr:rod shape-determining protein MreC [Candidatus Omnitrophota bacterium]
MRRWRSYYFLAVPVVLLILTFQYPRLNEAFRSLLFGLTRPFLIVGAGVRQGVSAARYNLGTFWNAVSQLQDHQTRILSLESRLLQYREMEKENQRLKKLMNFSPSPATKSIGARVIGEDMTPWRKVIVIDKGTRHGIAKDMVLLAPEGLVGRVLEAEPFTARAILLPDPDCRVSALTVNGRSQGVVAGSGTDKLKMKYLSLDTEIAINEEVITSGIESIFPKGLLIGKVEAVEREGDGLHLLAVVTPAVRFSKLEEVLCLVSSPGK